MRKTDSQSTLTRNTSANFNVDRLDESEDGGTSSTSAPFFISQRFLLAVLGFLGFYVVYSLRVNLSFALVCMVNDTAVRSLASDQNDSSAQVNTNQFGESGNSTSTSLGGEDGEFVWSLEEQGLMLSSFFWGYIVTQIPGGWLAGRFGGKYVYGLSMLLCIVCTMVTPALANVSYWAVIALRIVQGLAQGVTFPAMYALWSHWAPPYERSRLVSYSTAGLNVGTILPLSVAGVLCANVGWESLFYVLGGISCVWLLMWAFLVFDTPNQHPRISAREKSYINTSLCRQMGPSSTGNIKKQRVPWRGLFTSVPVWAIIVNHFCYNWGNYTLLTMLPRFMRDILGFDIKSNGLYTALPYLATWLVMFVSGPSADYLIKRKILSIKNVRRIFNSAGCILPGLFLVCAGRVDCDTQWAGVLFLVIGQAFAGFRFAGYMCSHIDIAPKYAGVLFGMSNVGGTASGIIAPYLAGLLLKEQSAEEWQMVFNISCGVMCFGAIFYALFIDGELQPWAVTEINLQQSQSLNDISMGQSNANITDKC